MPLSKFKAHVHLSDEITGLTSTVSVAGFTTAYTQLDLIPLLRQEFDNVARVDIISMSKEYKVMITRQRTLKKSRY